MPWHAVDFEGPVGASPVTGRVTGAGDAIERVLLVRDADGRLHATEPTCPHLGQPLSDARVEGEVLECSHHAYRFRLGDGVCTGPGEDSGQRVDRLRVLPVREQADQVMVHVGDGAT